MKSPSRNTDCSYSRVRFVGTAGRIGGSRRLPLRGGRGLVRMNPVNRRGVIAVQVMVFLTLLIGMAALTVDVGFIWNVRADLQRTADAAALAAAARLADVDDAATHAREAAEEYVGRNDVFNSPVTLSVGNVSLGRAELQDGRYVFQEVNDDEFPDAVRVRVEATKQYYFAQIFGKSSKRVGAEATALLVPRDIAIVADLSASHNDDSELGSYRDTQINIWDVWGALPGGSDSVESTWTPASLAGLPLDENGFHPQSAGPAWGFFRNLKWGQTNINAAYQPTTDTGLIKLRRYGGGTADGWVKPELRDYLATLQFQNNSFYSANEVNEILDTGHHGNSTRFRRQVAVALGLARWDSGKSGGAWANIPGAIDGNGDDRVDSWELTWLEPYFDEPGDRWLDFIYWASSTGTRMAMANSNFRDAYGPKTFTNYLLESRWSHADTPELVMTPTQPMQAVKDSVELMVELVSSFENDDQIALDIYGYSALHQVPLVRGADLDEVSIGLDGLSNMQAGHYDGWTNMGGGLEKGIETLTTEPARSAAHKMIVLLTDGQANINRLGQWPAGSYTDQQQILQQARDYVREEAERAAGLGIRIFAVSVGAYADTDLMDEVAGIGNGEHLEATSTDIATYQAQLEDIFVRLGGQRPVELIN